MISLQIRNPGNSSRNAASSSFTEIGSSPALTLTAGCRSAGAWWFPAQFEEDAPAELVAVLAPPVREQVHDLKATSVFGQLFEGPHGGDAVGAVVADFDLQRAVAAVDGDLEQAAGPRRGVLQRVGAQL